MRQRGPVHHQGRLRSHRRSTDRERSERGARGTFTLLSGTTLGQPDAALGDMAEELPARLAGFIEHALGHTDTSGWEHVANELQ